MRFCSKCGKINSDEATVCSYCDHPIKTCPNCKTALGDNAVSCPRCGFTYSKYLLDDYPDGKLFALGLFIPLAGFIYYLVNRDNRPKKSSSAGKGALVGFFIGLVITLIYFIVISVMINSMFYYI